MKIVFFDCDGVLIFGIPWGQMELALGISEKTTAELWKSYYSGKISFKKWNDITEEFYREKKLTKSIYIDNMKKYSINPEARQIIKYLKSQKIKIAIISSGTDTYVKEVAKKLKVNYWRANYRFLFDKKGRFFRMEYGIEDPKAKVQEVKEICKKLKISPTESIFVGDSDNDIAAFKFTKHGVLYKSKNENHKKLAWKTIENLLEIKDIIEASF